MNASTAPRNARLRVGVFLVVAAWLVTRLLQLEAFDRSDIVYYFMLKMEGRRAPEYGPLFNIILDLPTLVLDPRTTVPWDYIRAYKLMGLLVDGAVLWALLRRTALEAAAFLVLAGAMLMTLWLDRADLLMAGPLALAAASPGAGFAGGVALAALIKFPMVGLAPVPFLRDRSRATALHGLGALALFGGGTLMAAAAWGPVGSYSALFFHGARTPQREALLGNLLDAARLWWGAPFTASVDVGSIFIHGADDAFLRACGLGLFLVGCGITAVFTVVAGTRITHGTALLASVVAYTLFNPFGSPQYAIPVLVVAAVAVDASRMHGRILLGILLAYAALAGAGYGAYTHDTEQDGPLVAYTMARNAALVVAWAWLLRHGARVAGTGTASTGP